MEKKIRATGVLLKNTVRSSRGVQKMMNEIKEKNTVAVVGFEELEEIFEEIFVGF